MILKWMIFLPILQPFPRVIHDLKRRLWQGSGNQGDFRVFRAFAGRGFSPAFGDILFQPMEGGGRQGLGSCPPANRKPSPMDFDFFARMAPSSTWGDHFPLYTFLDW